MQLPSLRAANTGACDYQISQNVLLLAERRGPPQTRRLKELKEDLPGCLDIPRAVTAIGEKLLPAKALLCSGSSLGRKVFFETELCCPSSPDAFLS